MIGLLGGTFDPVHHGHLRLAVELYQHLSLEQVRLIPLNRPNHRLAPQASAAQRLAMLQLAVAGEPYLQADDREIRRGGVSYSVDTLMELRAQMPQQSLCLIIGVDAWAGLPRWHRWQEIAQLAHLIVAHRPGSSVPDDEAIARVWGKPAAVDISALQQAISGEIMVTSLPMLDISSTRIRARLHDGHTPRYLLPDPVLAYLHEQRLYSP